MKSSWKLAVVRLQCESTNDAPVAVAVEVTGTEDATYIFNWSNFRVSNVDSDTLGITINCLPADGLLQYYDGIQWAAMLTGQCVTMIDSDAGLLCFGTDVNE